MANSSSGMKKLDNRLRVLIERSVSSRHRSLFVIVGKKAKDQVVILHHMLSKSEVKARPTVLWCYKKDLGFSSHRKKIMKQLQKKIKSGNADVNEQNPFEMFIASTQIRYCYYSETQNILGNTFGMCVLQDFEAITPNVLARTIETVNGGGIVAILLESVSSLKQLYAMAMDVHSRFRTESHADVVGRFNERFILSLSSCSSCLVVDDQLNIIPIVKDDLTDTSSKLAGGGNHKRELKQLKESLTETKVVGKLIDKCCTADQAKALLKLIDVVSEKSMRTTVAMTAARGRGKSACLGLALSAAIGFGFSNIFVTSPSPENLSTLFEFVIKGLLSIEYEEHTDFDVIQSSQCDMAKAVIRINVHHNQQRHRQVIQYIQPNDAAKLSQAELLVIDEAAAIPLPVVKRLFGPYLIMMASTISGYEGTGRSLSLKLVSQLRHQSTTLKEAQMNTSGSVSSKASEAAANRGRSLTEVKLDEAIRYANNDPVEAWLSGLLCLEATADSNLITKGIPSPSECDLFYVNRDALFSYHPSSERFLQRIMSLYVASHYKNSPNDLQMLSDAPAHHIFVLLPPFSSETSTDLPDILCVIQICFEGSLSKQSVSDSLNRGKRASGDLIPWTISQQFQETSFATLCGARIVRIATHPDYQGMGYGKRAMQLLHQYFGGEIACTDEVSLPSTALPSLTDEDLLSDSSGNQIAIRSNLPPLLLHLNERPHEFLHYIGVSFGLTKGLFKFWQQVSYKPVYLRQTTNELTGEHTCIVIRAFGESNQQWLWQYYDDFTRRLLQLVSYQARSLDVEVVLAMINDRRPPDSSATGLITPEQLNYELSPFDFNRLEMYSQNLVDHHLITDLVPKLAEICALKRIDVSLSAIQKAILLSIGLQRLTVDECVRRLDTPASQLLALFNRTVRKMVTKLNEIRSEQVASIANPSEAKKAEFNAPIQQSIDEELKQFCNEKELKEFEVKDSSDWNQLADDCKLVSIKSTLKKKRKLADAVDYNKFASSGKKSSEGAKGEKKKKLKKMRIKN